MASTFSTASTAATIPVTLRALTGQLGVSRESSQLAACVGTNFNNDGTALYQATAVLFMAQASGFHLGLDRPVDHRPDDAGGERRGRGHPLGQLRHPAADLRRRRPARRQDPRPADDRLVPRPLPDDLERPRRHDRGRLARPHGDRRHGRHGSRSGMEWQRPGSIRG